MPTETHDDAADRACPGTHPSDQHPAGAPVWCLAHTTSIGVDVARIPELTALVAVRRDGRLNARTTHTDTTRRTSPAPASPSPAWDAVDAVEKWARHWCEVLADQLNRRHQHAPAPTNAGLPARDLGEDIRYLSRFLTPLLVGPASAEFGDAATTLVRSLERLAGEDRARNRLPLPCPGCDLLALVREEGTDRIECVSCHRRLDEGTYSELVTEQAALAAS